MNRFAARAVVALIGIVFFVTACTSNATRTPTSDNDTTGQSTADRSIDADTADAEPPQRERQAIVLALAALGTKEDGSPLPLPARMGILTSDGPTWNYRFIEDADSNVFHKVMAYESKQQVAGILTLGGMKAAVKLWNKDGTSRTLWEKDFGGQFSRMRDAEVGDVFGDGSSVIIVATHDQGVIALIRPDDTSGFRVEEIDEQKDTIVHEIELGDLNGDGTLEVYATPSEPNRVDGTPQSGKVVRYVPALESPRTDVVDLGERHAKEILVDDVNGDGRDELYVAVEAVSGGQVQIRRYEADTDPSKGTVIATLRDRLCRFLTAGDVDGDGSKEMVAATSRSGLWLLRPRSDEAWQTELIAKDSSGFEHAAILLDLDNDGRDELYVASDDQGEVRQYRLENENWMYTTLLEYSEDVARFTWNIMAVPVSLLPAGAQGNQAVSDTTEP